MNLKYLTETKLYHFHKILKKLGGGGGGGSSETLDPSLIFRSFPPGLTQYCTIASALSSVPICRVRREKPLYVDCTVQDFC